MAWLKEVIGWLDREVFLPHVYELRRQVRTRRVAEILHTISRLLAAGHQLNTAVSIAAGKQGAGWHVRRVLRSFSEELADGAFLSQLMGRHGWLFPSPVPEMIVHRGVCP